MFNNRKVIAMDMESGIYTTGILSDLAARPDSDNLEMVSIIYRISEHRPDQEIPVTPGISVAEMHDDISSFFDDDTMLDYFVTFECDFNEANLLDAEKSWMGTREEMAENYEAVAAESGYDGPASRGLITWDEHIDYTIEIGICKVGILTGDLYTVKPMW